MNKPNVGDLFLYLGTGNDLCIVIEVTNRDFHFRNITADPIGKVYEHLLESFDRHR